MKVISENCTACGACVYSCPKKAIKLQYNERMEMVAVISEDGCIRCGLCQKCCPECNEVRLWAPRSCYAAWTNNCYDYNTSSSGGMATVLSKWSISNGGVVYGAVTSGDGSVRHARIDNIGSIEDLKGSKYVQSDFHEVFELINKDIIDEKKIVIIGTPCQIASVQRAFSQEELKGVFLIDLVCHGVPPAAYFTNYLESLLGEEPSDLSVTFRKKKYQLCVEKSGRTIYSKKYQLDLYYRSFMYGLILRENCYMCKYARADRIGDLTICDFWGIERKTMLSDSVPEYISCVLVNTKKGEMIFKQCKSDIHFEKREISEAINGNYNFKKPSVKHKDREMFIRLMQEGKSFVESANKTSIRKDIMKERCLDVIKAPYRKMKYGRWGGIF